REGAEITEQTVDGTSRVVATSELFIGRNSTDSGGRDGYSGLRVDVEEGRPLTIRLTPLVSCRDGKSWLDADPDPISLRS
nr:metallophosphoesterase [Synechococcus sp.]